jgi:NADH-quinone oxidoreductase subunit I
MCGYCEEVCPEQAIFLTKEYQTVGLTRESMIYPMEKLLEMGGIRPDPIKKWSRLAPPEGVAAGVPTHGGDAR